MLSHDFPWDQPQDQQNAERQNNCIVHVTKDRYEIRDQIDRRKCVTSNGNRQDSCIPRDPRIATGQPYRHDIALQRPPPISQFLEHSLFHLALPTPSQTIAARKATRPLRRRSWRQAIGPSQTQLSGRNRCWLFGRTISAVRWPASGPVGSFGGNLLAKLDA
jgi:hypothetical protein